MSIACIIVDRHIAKSELPEVTIVFHRTVHNTSQQSRAFLAESLDPLFVSSVLTLASRYLRSGHEAATLECVKMVWSILLEKSVGGSSITIAVPSQHVLIELDAYLLAVGLHDRRGVGQKIVGVNHDDFLISFTATCFLSFAQVVDHESDFAVPDFSWIKLFHSGRLLEWRDCEFVLAGDTQFWIPN